MKTAGSAASNKTSKRKSTKRTDRSVPFDEMRRLMRVYGSVKCLRKRKGGPEDAKVASVRRKFYRWFPDFESRFERVAPGEGTALHYRPRFGHDFEMRYREERRREDGELLAQKRARCRHGKQCGVDDKPNIAQEPPAIVEPGEVAAPTIATRPASSVESVDAASAPENRSAYGAESAYAASSRPTGDASRLATITRRVTPPLREDLAAILTADDSDNMLDDALRGPLDERLSDSLPFDLSPDSLLDDHIMAAVFDEMEYTFFGTEGRPDNSATSDGTSVAPPLPDEDTDGPAEAARSDLPDAMAEELSKPTSLPDIVDASSSVSPASPTPSHSSWEDASWDPCCDRGDPFGEPIEDVIEGRASILDDVAVLDVVGDDGSASVYLSDMIS